ncbi:MAG: hypothetical protein MI923_08195, partial [Phycisphaerales bacterium]|nr:hypothetical protein [Phycisphaerales bacterium]
MPLYSALIRIRLDEPDQDSANQTAQEIANQLNDQSMTTCADVVLVGPEPQEADTIQDVVAVHAEHPLGEAW